MKISNEVIPDAYKFSKQVFENKLTLDEATLKLHITHNVNINSAKDYVYYFKYLMTGIGSCRSLSSYTQEFFLKKIHEDYGKERLVMSLLHFKILILMFEKQNNSTKVSMRKIYDKYIKLIK